MDGQLLLNRRRCERARRARDARFDGQFFTAVKTTGIYCRSICPASPPLEKNVEYYTSAIAAAQAGFRPCLRCRPDSAPHSNAWHGAQTTFNRALALIQQGVLQTGSVIDLSNRLGISDRYLRELFEDHLGASPKKVAIYQQCLFAKQLLHESNLTITDIAFASGFQSVRRFNEAMKEQIGLTPRDIRKRDEVVSGALTLKLSFRPPFDWGTLSAFLNNRVIENLEWDGKASDGNVTYSRTIQYKTSRGYFTIIPVMDKHYLRLMLFLDDYQYLNPIVQRIRLLFDVDAPIEQIDRQLSVQLRKNFNYTKGLRIPGVWSVFEAGIRAILGQQVSVAAARKLVTALVLELGEVIELADGVQRRLFPTPKAVSNSELAFFKMPQTRKDALRRLAEYVLNDDNPNDVDEWLALKGIGPWTVNYVKLRGVKDPDVWLAGDAGLNNALQKIDVEIDLDAAQPWRSYLTFQLWNQL